MRVFLEMEQKSLISLLENNTGKKEGSFEFYSSFSLLFHLKEKPRQ
jgi:hypothetical protein